MTTPVLLFVSFLMSISLLCFLVSFLRLLRLERNTPFFKKFIRALVTEQKDAVEMGWVPLETGDFIRRYYPQLPPLEKWGDMAPSELMSLVKWKRDPKEYGITT